MTITTIDGSHGEGGGQILRTALAISLIEQRPIRVENIRAGRAKPGLLRQHLTAVTAAKAVGDAEVTGDELGSRALTFKPRTLRGGTYELAIGTAGSTTLVLQTILPALLHAREPSTVRITGGTHNPAAPPVPFLQRTFLPLVARVAGRSRSRSIAWASTPRGAGRSRRRSRRSAPPSRSTSRPGAR